MTSYNASLIAYAFVKKGISEGTPVTQMKLQKLVYFAHGVYLATDKGPLIKEQFQAWKFGPVVPEIYQEYKIYGSNPILNTDLLDFFSVHDGYSDAAIANIDLSATKLIAEVWTLLKSFNALALSAWTHKEGSPWQRAYVEGASDIYIPNEEIKEYFKREVIKREDVGQPQ